MRSPAAALATVLCCFWVASVEAETTRMPRAELKAKLERGCNYFENVIRGSSSIGPSGAGHYMAPVVRSCRVVMQEGWLDGEVRAGGPREQMAAFLAMRSDAMLDGLVELSTRAYESRTRHGLMTSFGYSDSTVLLIMQREDLFRIARDIEGVASGRLSVAVRP